METTQMITDLKRQKIKMEKSSLKKRIETEDDSNQNVQYTRCVPFQFSQPNFEVLANLLPLPSPTQVQVVDMNLLDSDDQVHDSDESKTYIELRPVSATIGLEETKVHMTNIINDNVGVQVLPDLSTYEEGNSLKKSTEIPHGIKPTIYGEKYVGDNSSSENPGFDHSDSQHDLVNKTRRRNTRNVKLEKNIACVHLGCTKMFGTVGAMKRHFCIHNKKSVCLTCGKKFMNEYHLIKHQLVHTGERRFQCKFLGCGRRFPEIYNLQAHKKVHTGARPFVCSVKGCNNRFIHSANLKAHFLTHSEPNLIFFIPEKKTS